MAKQMTHKPPTIETVNVGAAAVDIGSREHMAALNPDLTDAPVRAFGTFTHDLHDLADWFKSHGMTSVAMETTGVYPTSIRLTKVTSTCCHGWRGTLMLSPNPVTDALSWPSGVKA